METTTLITAFLAALTPVVVQIISNHTKQRALDATLAKHEQHQQDEIEEIKREMVEVKKRLDSHNGYAEKFADTRRDIAMVQKDVEYIKEQLKNTQMCRIK